MFVEEMPSIRITFQCFCSAHTADLNKSDNNYNLFFVFLPTWKFGLAVKVTRIMMIFRRLSSAHTTNLNKSDNNYNVFLVVSLLKSVQELERACQSSLELVRISKS